MNENGPEELEKFNWEKYPISGSCNISDMLIELNNKLSIKEYLQFRSGAYRPVIIFVTDGHLNDDYKTSLTEIKKNKWFTYATKIGVGIGETPKTEMISDIVGNVEAVIKPDDIELFDTLIGRIEGRNICGSFIADEDDNEWGWDYDKNSDERTSDGNPCTVIGESVILPQKTDEIKATFKLNTPSGEILVDQIEIMLRECQFFPCTPDEALNECLEVNIPSKNYNYVIITNKGSYEMELIRIIKHSCSIELDILAFRHFYIEGTVEIRLDRNKAFLFANKQDSYLHIYLSKGQKSTMSNGDELYCKYKILECNIN